MPAQCRLHSNWKKAVFSENEEVFAVWTERSVDAVRQGLNAFLAPLCVQ
jgi:hypothetical protein